MAHHHLGGRSRGANDTPTAMKAAVITMHLFFQVPFTHIEAKTGVSESTATKIYSRARQDAGNEDFHDMLASLSPKSERPGRVPKVKQGSKLSHEIRQDILRWEDYRFEEAAAPALHKHGVKAARSLIERVAHQHTDPLCHGPIVRGIPPKKPALNASQKEARFEHCSWLEDLIKRTQGKVIIICSDESRKQFGPGHSGGGKARVSRPMGKDANEYAIPEKSAKFSFSFWGAMCSDDRIPRPCIVWEPESQEQKDELEKKLIKDNEDAKERAERSQRNANIQGTWEYNHMKSVNYKIRGDNERLTQQGIQKGRRYTRRPEQEFKYEVFTRGKGKGMDAAWYANNILKLLLYPYYFAV
ncbi:uncharacterized protein BDZ99DRAFT_552320 [Mytilinidion resinicola]|uniref:Uncharacterized protein n=1 Tax=Mytilinidion resinicola TaxID=574789 RepID=A0A6A6Y0B3_9PEZI|nr:uncharacterized protein BDZ99DRAFT_552320 [Mytilinidion resinicola]KAF2801988.1 hypothetical protein BDZ99DRAFT_552320 [Mytilinidion resinicola]